MNNKLKENRNPFVSVIVITYNQEQWVTHAVRSALDQDYPVMEIIVSDDCSTDETWARIEETVASCQQKHPFELIWNDRNLGITGNLTEALKHASGELIVLMAGDDVSMSNRVSKTVEAWLQAGRPPAVGCSLEVIDEVGELISHHSKKKRFQFDKQKLLGGPESLIQHYRRRGGIIVLGACLAYRADVFSKFGWDLRDCHNEDLLLLGRALLLGGCLVIPDVLVQYRVTGRNISMSSGTNSNKQSTRPISWTVSRKRKAYKIQELGRLDRRICLYTEQMKDLLLASEAGLIAESLAAQIVSALEDKLKKLEIRSRIARAYIFIAVFFLIKEFGFKRGVSEILEYHIPRVHALVRVGVSLLCRLRARQTDV